MLVVTGPVTSRTSAWRGEATKRKPNLSRSYTTLPSAWISSSQPLHEPASTSRMASVRPRRWRAARSTCAASSASAASSTAGAASVSGPWTRLLNSILRMADLEIVSRVRTVKRLVAQREVGHDVALDHRFEHRPLEPGRIAQVAAVDVSVGANPDPCQNVAAKSLDQRHPFACLGRGQRSDPFADRPGGKPVQHLLDQRDALFHLADANPDAGVHVAFLQHRGLESQGVVRRIAGSAPRVEGTAPGATDIPAASELLRELGGQSPRAHRAVLE